MSDFAGDVAAVQATPVLTIGPDRSLAAADALLRHHRISCLAVADDRGRVLGALSRKDLLRARGRGPALADALVSAHMTSPCVTVRPGTPVDQACRTMVERHIHRVFVAHEDAAVGVFSTREAMSLVLAARVHTPIGSFMSAPVIVVDATAPLVDALALLERGGVGGLVVLDAGLAVGMLTEVEALAAKGQPGSTPVEQVMTQALLCLAPETPLHRAAGFALATRARRILVVEHRQVRGTLTGIDFARVVAGDDPWPLARG